VTSEVTTEVEAVVFSMAEGGVAATTTEPYLLLCSLIIMRHLFELFFLQCASHLLAIINCACFGLVLCYPVPLI
jgi:hypothetical protein